MDLGDLKGLLGSADAKVTSPSKLYNEFFTGAPGDDTPTWMAFSGGGSGGLSSTDENEENLLDDVHALYVSNSMSIDSSRSYSRSASLESADSQDNEGDMETEVVLRVAVCCRKCENKVMTLTQMEGVSSVSVDRKTEKVTVIGTARPRDVLEQCKKLFQQTKIWSPEEDIMRAQPDVPDKSTKRICAMMNIPMARNLPIQGVRLMEIVIFYAEPIKQRGLSFQAQIFRRQKQ